MTFPPEHDAPARSRPPNAAGRRVATDPLVTWATASRDSERDAYLALYAALYPPPGADPQECAS